MKAFLNSNLNYIFYNKQFKICTFKNIFFVCIIGKNLLKAKKHIKNIFFKLYCSYPIYLISQHSKKQKKQKAKSVKLKMLF